MTNWTKKQIKDAWDKKSKEEQKEYGSFEKWIDSIIEEEN